LRDRASGAACTGGWALRRSPAGRIAQLASPAWARSPSPVRGAELPL